MGSSTTSAVKEGTRTDHALRYHEQDRPGKIAVVPTKPCRTAAELSLAYTPGVAVPCLEIKTNPGDAYRYTAKGNLVGVISNGTAVLGLGDIGPLAGKPVMEGKVVLFKRFAGIDGFDLEVHEQDPQRLVEVIAALEPTFGGINLEDIKAPECFYVERELQKRLHIPVFHDDQHGTAIITSAGVLNALKLAGKKLGKVKIVFSGAGAAAIACAEMLLELGADRSTIFMVDRKGLLTTKRLPELNEYKSKFAQNAAEASLADVLKGADIFIGVSTGNLLTAAHIRSMARHPIVFAMANPIPEIAYEEGTKAVSDIIMATGRSDYPNQVNNVLGFPYIFRGALDVRATRITSGMKIAAAQALAQLAHLPVPNEVEQAYGRKFAFGPDYIIPKPFDPRLLYTVAPAVADAALKDGVAQKKINRARYVQWLKELSQQLAAGEWDFSSFKG